MRRAQLFSLAASASGTVKMNTITEVSIRQQRLQCPSTSPVPTMVSGRQGLGLCQAFNGEVAWSMRLWVRAGSTDGKVQRKVSGLGGRGSTRQRNCIKAVEQDLTHFGRTPGLKTILWIRDRPESHAA